MSTTDDIIEPIYLSYVLFHNSGYFLGDSYFRILIFLRLRDHSDNFSKPCLKPYILCKRLRLKKTSAYGEIRTTVWRWKFLRSEFSHWASRPRLKKCFKGFDLYILKQVKTTKKGWFEKRQIMLSMYCWILSNTDKYFEPQTVGGVRVTKRESEWMQNLCKHTCVK